MYTSNLSTRPQTSIAAFKTLLASLGSRVRILALCGAGLSASSGLPTFRGAGGLWRNHDSMSLATPEAFAADPGLVWLFYAWRRHLALKVKPNRGHEVLAEVAMRRVGFMCATQNVDGLAKRANHPSESLRELHASLFTLKCANSCGWIEYNNTQDPLCPALAPASEDYPADQTLPLLDPNTPLATIAPADLPHCPNCGALSRPGVIWFGEQLPEEVLDDVDDFVDLGVDLMLVIGTAATVYPAAGYVSQASKKGAKVVVVNMDPSADGGLGGDDFFFQGDAATILPEMFEDVLGEYVGDAGVPSDS